MSSMRDLYHFTKIRAARNVKRGKVNIIGVVLEHGFPRKSKGTDWYYFVRIIDETYHDPGLPVQIFFETMDRSPRVLSPGDIIQFQSVTVKVFGDEVSAVYNKQYSSFALYDARDGSVPYQTSQRFRERDLDKRFVTDLRRWFRDFPIDEGPNNFSFARQLTEGEHFNLFCKVLYVYEGAEGQWTAFVWDGSDAPPALIHKKLLEEMHQPLALHMESFSLARDIVCSFPTLGTVLRVISQDIEPDFLPLLRAGNWVKLTNLMCELHDGLWRVVLTQYSRIHYASNGDQFKPQPQRLYDERLLRNPRNLRRMPQWSLPWPSRITEVDFDDDCEFRTLMDVVTSTEVMVSYKCVVRVVSVLPCRAMDYNYPNGILRIRLTLEDPTTRIHAFLYAEDGLKFFNGPSSDEVLSTKRNALVGASANIDGEEEEDTPRNPPWVQVCLRAQYQIEGDLESREYIVFGTKLRD
ncbi:protection of telomeres protein 1b-like [Rosa sericea]